MVKIINANQTVNSVVATNAHSLTTLDRCIHLLVWPESYEYPSSSLLYSSWAYNFWDSAHSYYLSMLQERPPTVRLNKRCGFASLQQLSSCMSQRVSLSTLYIKPHVILPVICKARVWILEKNCRKPSDHGCNQRNRRWTFFRGCFANGGGEARVQSMLGQNVKELATKSDRERWQGQWVLADFSAERLSKVL